MFAQCRFLLRGITVKENLERFILFWKEVRAVHTATSKQEEKLSSALQCCTMFT